MTDTTTILKVQSKPELAGHITRVWRDVLDLEIAAGDLVRSLERFNTDDIPEGVRELASSMCHDAEEVLYEIDNRGFSTWVDELQALADEEDAS